MNKILIIEDEENVAIRLSNMIKKIISGVEIVDIIDSVEDGVKWFNSNPYPDLIFVDIQLSDGISFSIFEQVEVECPIVFTTAYDNFAIKAFELNSIDYLLKPVSEEALVRSLKKYESIKESYSNNIQVNQIRNIINSMQDQKESYKKRFLINKSASLKVIPTNEILYFQTENKLVYLITKSGDKYEITYTLDQIEKKLNPSDFFRINRQYIISVESIEEIHNYFNYKLKVELKKSDDNQIIVSRHKALVFKDWLNR